MRNEGIRFFSLSGWLAAALIGLGFATSLALNLPGHLSYDSLAQLLEGRTGIYEGWHPPVMSFLLGIGDAIHPGTALFVLFDTALIYGSLLSLLWLKREAHWATPVVLLPILLSPQLILYPGLVWKDVLFAASMAAGFICLAHAGSHWNNLRLRNALLLPSVLLLVLAVLARQNGMAVIPFAAAAVGWMAMQGETQGKPLRTAILWSVAAAALVCGVWAAGSAALQLRATGQSSPLTQIQFLQGYDLAGFVANDPQLALDRMHEEAPDLEKALRTDAARLYTPERNDTLAGSSRLQAALNNTDPETIKGEWWDVVRSHPWLYLKVRWDAFRWVFFTPDITACRPVYAGIGGYPDAMTTLGIAPRFDARDRFLSDYAAAFKGTPVFSHPAFAVLALILLVILLRRRRPADIAMAFMILSTFAFAATFFLISLACDYRYLYCLDLAAMAATLYWALDPDFAFTIRSPG